MKNSIDAILKNQYLTYFYGHSNIDPNILLDEKKINTCLSGFSALKSKDYINTSENRPITHHHLRTNQAQSDVIHQIESLNQKFSRFTTICHIGIGGSMNGVKCIYHALNCWDYPKKRTALFISNHDEDHIHTSLSCIDISQTLFIIASKSGKTIEISKIIDTIIPLQDKPRQQFFETQTVLITANQTMNSPHHSTIYFDTGVGGRFSTTSPIGLVTLGLVFEPTLCAQLLNGAHLADINASQTTNNIALTQALIRFHQTESGLAIVPYGESLLAFNSFFSQLICESLGKGASILNEPLTHQVAPILMQGDGPDAQHTFFQQLHQANPTIPVEFFITTPNAPNQHHLLQQLLAQSIGLFKGSHHSNPNDHFSGNRASTITIINERTVDALGYLIATLENRIMFEGFLNNINVFDQPGVQLGKRLTETEFTPNGYGHLLLESLLHKKHIEE